jgi:hypothetical protein
MVKPLKNSSMSVFMSLVEYKISPITIFDNDHQLWETHVGIDSKEMPLLYSCWGKTEEESRKMAEYLTIQLLFKGC